MKFFTKQKNKSFAHKSMRKGFTLIEIMVATSIFMIIMLVAMGALVSSSDAAKKSQALRSAMDNVNFALESMTRTLRTGYNYYCTTSNFSLPVTATNDCDTGLSIAFKSTQNKNYTDMAYVLNKRPDGSGVVQRYTYDSFSGKRVGPTDMTSSDVDIQKLDFYVKGSTTTDGVQPSAYILMKGNVKIKGVNNVFAIQTMASQRATE